ncbi:hypothetical protein BGZ94_007756 [Podila epigama]|nr:hypothetical protein BGZ94_007756 [Podila epigama]
MASPNPPTLSIDTEGQQQKKQQEQQQQQAQNQEQQQNELPPTVELNTDTTISPDDSTLAQEMPLSPSSVRSYRKSREASEDDDDEEERTDSEVNDEESYLSDPSSPKATKTTQGGSSAIKSQEDEDEDVDVTHLGARLEALDGTSKLKTVKDEADDEDEDDGQDYSNEEDDGPLVDNVAQMTLTSTSSTTNTTKGEQGGELYQDPSGLGAAQQQLEERLQEPVKPHIAVPCYIETAANPPRTRITLKYLGKHISNSQNSSSTVLTSPLDPVQAPSTRGRKNYMVATDLSGESWHATEWAITTILRSGDELNVVTIVEDDKSGKLLWLPDSIKAVKKGVQTEMREDAEKLTKNINDQLEHTSLTDITVVIHIIAATKSMGAKELLIEMIDDLDDLSTVIVGSRGRGAIKG